MSMHATSAVQVSITFDLAALDPRLPEPAGSGADDENGHRAAGPVSGSVSRAGAAPLRFDGWLELLAVLESVVAGPADHRRAS